MLNPSVREAIFHLKTAVTFLIFIASKLTNEVPFERRKIYLSTDYNYSINEWVFSYWPCYMFKVCNNGPRMAVMAQGNPRMAVMAQGNAEGHYSHPRAIITDREHITGPI
jgi:hypothetical protein